MGKNKNILLKFQPLILNLLTDIN